MGGVWALEAGLSSVDEWLSPRNGWGYHGNLATFSFSTGVYFPPLAEAAQDSHRCWKDASTILLDFPVSRIMSCLTPVLYKVFSLRYSVIVKKKKWTETSSGIFHFVLKCFCVLHWKRMFNTNLTWKNIHSITIRSFQEIFDKVSTESTLKYTQRLIMLEFSSAPNHSSCTCRINITAMLSLLSLKLLRDPCWPKEKRNFLLAYAQQSSSTFLFSSTQTYSYGPILPPSKWMHWKPNSLCSYIWK